MSAGDIVCSRCGSPFPTERGNRSVTCVVCGQLRPDLDMTLEDDEHESSGTPPAREPETPVLRVAKGMNAPPPLPAPPPLRAASAPPAKAAEPVKRRRDLEMPMPEEEPRPHRQTMFELLGPVVVVMAPLITAMVSAMTLLQRASDFGTGTWYAAGTLFFLAGAATLFLGLFVSGALFACRLRWKTLLRTAFILCALAMCYVSVTEVVRRVQIRTDAMPAFNLR